MFSGANIMTIVRLFRGVKPRPDCTLDDRAAVNSKFYSTAVTMSKKETDKPTPPDTMHGIMTVQVFGDVILIYRVNK